MKDNKDNKGNKGNNVGIELIATCVFISFLVSLVVSNVLNTKSTEEFRTEMREAFDNEDRQDAIEKLCELRGKIEEIHDISVLASNSETEKILSERLRNIAEYKNSENPYLKDIQIQIPNDTLPVQADEVLMKINEMIAELKNQGKGR